MSKEMNKVFLKKLETDQLTALPQSIDFEMEGNEIRITLPADAVKENMQVDKAAFEGWAVILHTITKKQIFLDIKAKSASGETWDEIGEKNVGHYNRFLYRITRFSESYSFITLSDALKKHLGEFFHKGKYYRFDSSNLVVNCPGKEAGCNDKAEIQIEKMFCESSNLLVKKTQTLFNITLQSKLYRQLPVGIFKDKVNKNQTVFTGGASAIDLWGISESRDSLVVYELKAFDNAKVGIISELFFYANLMYDIYGNNPNFGIDESKKTDKRGFKKLWDLKDIGTVYAVFLTMGLHSAISDSVIKNLNTTHIRYNRINYDVNKIIIKD